MSGASRLATCVAGMVLAGAGWAQAQQAAVEQCRAAPSDAERIACLEAVLGAVEPQRGGLRIPVPFIGGGGGNAEPVESSSPAAAELGAEQVAAREGVSAQMRARESDANRMTANIVVQQTDALGNLVVQLDNGQVWRQTERTTTPIRINLDTPLPVEIRGSGFGGYRMSLPSNRRIVVERVR